MLLQKIKFIIIIIIIIIFYFFIIIIIICFSLNLFSLININISEVTKMYVCIQTPSLTENEL